MKNIDVKSLIIGALLTSTIFLGVASTGTTDKWDKEQVWIYMTLKDETILGFQGKSTTKGWEPIGFTVGEKGAKGQILVRKRFK